MAINGKLFVVSYLCIYFSFFKYINSEHISYIGCFFDAYNPETGSSKGALRVLPDAHITFKDMTIGNCIQFCTDAETHRKYQMQYAGVEAGNECWCGTEDAQYDLYGQIHDSRCMKDTCLGNPGQFCGSPLIIAVYNLTLVRCQLPILAGLQASNFNFIPVYDHATFTCLLGYQLSGPDTVQCIFDDHKTDTRWASDLPQCTSISAPFSTTRTSVSTIDVHLQQTSSTTASKQEPLTQSVKQDTGLPIPATIGTIVTVLVLASVLVITVVVVIRKRTDCNNGRRDTANHDLKVANTFSEDGMYLEPRKQPSMQESIYRLVSPQDSSYQGLVNPQISTYQGLIIPQQQRSLEVYDVVDPGDDQIKAHETGHIEYQNVSDSNTYQNTGPTNTSREGRVPIPPPVERDEIIYEPGDYVNVKN